MIKVMVWCDRCNHQATIAVSEIYDCSWPSNIDTTDLGMKNRIGPVSYYCAKCAAETSAQAYALSKEEGK